MEPTAGMKLRIEARKKQEEEELRMKAINASKYSKTNRNAIKNAVSPKTVRSPRGSGNTNPANDSK